MSLAAKQTCGPGDPFAVVSVGCRNKFYFSALFPYIGVLKVLKYCRAVIQTQTFTERSEYRVAAAEPLERIQTEPG